MRVDELDCGQRAYRGSAHSRIKEPNGKPPLLWPKPAIHERDADGKRRAANAEKDPPTSRAPRLEWPIKPRNKTGSTVMNETTGNVTRPPNRSLTTPTGIRSREPTMTGPATTSAGWKAEIQPSFSRRASGESKA